MEGTHKGLKIVFLFFGIILVMLGVSMFVLTQSTPLSIALGVEVLLIAITLFAEAFNKNTLAKWFASISVIGLLTVVLAALYWGVAS